MSSVGKYWDNQATNFDSIYLGESLLGKRMNQLLRKAVYERFRITFAESGNVAGKHILDIGCGSGHYMLEFAKRGAASVTGVDFAANMLDLARGLVEREGVADRCKFLQGDFTMIELAQPVDIAIAMGVFDYVADPVAFLREMYAVARERIIASFPAENHFRMHVRRLRYQLRGCPVYFYTKPRLIRIAEEAGLRNFHLIDMPYSGNGFVLVANKT